ncbi:MAG: amino acid ABC transporter ATP-binding protein [Gemmatales bacterium]|nr:amino acid ABC transporter ATP-binding protein [Gemmatales bacterium]MDW8221526.1 amino acid ABC transporter ATP-binding protein [Gemmatales bacterium]
MFEIEIRGLVKRLGGRTILNGIELTIEQGETLAVLGPSGSGKSTLLRCLNALTAFDAGQIRVGDIVLRPGKVPRDVAIQVRRQLGMVFQDFALFPHLRAIDNVALGPRLVLGLTKEQARQRGVQLLKRVGLQHRAEAFPAQLSGGEKQRVAIARALAMEPKGLLCDEITSALDPELKWEVLSVLADLKKDGLTMVVVTHEVGFARRVADRVCILSDGQILEVGLPQQVLENPKTARVQQFLARVMT